MRALLVSKGKGSLNLIDPSLIIAKLIILLKPTSNTTISLIYPAFRKLANIEITAYNFSAI